MRVVDIAQEIWQEIGNDTSTSLAAISYWIRGKVGAINNLLFEDFSINSDYEIVDGDGSEISIDVASIIKQMYKVYDAEVQIRSNMTALSSNSVLEVEDNGSRVKLSNKNEVSKTFVSIKNAEQENLKNLITAYRIKRASPTAVFGDDYINGIYGETTITDLRKSISL
jgi:hypothetical protein